MCSCKKRKGNGIDIENERKKRGRRVFAEMNSLLPLLDAQKNVWTSLPKKKCWSGIEWTVKLEKRAMTHHVDKPSL